MSLRNDGNHIRAPKLAFRVTLGVNPSAEKQTQ